MENLILVKTFTDPDFQDVPDNILIKNIVDGKLYMGNGTDEVDEVKTDKSNNWAKTFFYGAN